MVCRATSNFEQPCLWLKVSAIPQVGFLEVTSLTVLNFLKLMNKYKHSVIMSSSVRKLGFQVSGILCSAFQQVVSPKGSRQYCYSGFSLAQRTEALW